MKSLQEFASNKTQLLFAQATTLPSFFHHNLVDPARVVKVFNNDPQANIRIFYYQYLKLCFELDNVNYESYISKIQQIINNDGFKFIFYEDDDPSLFSDLQFKHLIMQFFGVLGDGNITVDSALIRFPVMDTVFIYFFRAFLILTGKAESLDSYIQRDELLQYLCQHFQVEITLHDRCIKFVQSDIFAYEQDPKQVFMAYMDYDKIQNESQLQPPSQDNHNYFDEAPQDYNYKQREIHQLVSSLEEHAEQSRPGPVFSHQELSENTDFELKGFNFAAKPEIQSQPTQNPTNPASHNSSRRGNTQMNQSYISNEFVDYTSAISLIGLDTKSNLKESGSDEGFKIQSIIKIDQYASNTAQNSNKPASKPSNFKLEYEYQSNYQGLESKNKKVDMGYSYQVDKISAYSAANFNQNVNSYVPKTNFSIDVPAFNKGELQEKKYFLQNDWQPTKDPGFTQDYSNQYISSSDYQKPSISSHSYQPISNTYYGQNDYTKTLDQKKPSSQSLHTSDSVQNIQNKKPISSEATKTQPIANYTPTYQNGYSYQSQFAGQVQTTKGATGKNPFGLNVSLEFTNSFTMKAMNQPFRSSVAAIRQKARNFRNSLVSYIK